MFKSGCVFVLERIGLHSLDSRIPSSYQFIHMFLLEQRFFLCIYRYHSSSVSSSREYVRLLCFILILCLHSFLLVTIIAERYTLIYTYCIHLYFDIRRRERIKNINNLYHFIEHTRNFVFSNKRLLLHISGFWDTF